MEKLYDPYDKFVEGELSNGLKIFYAEKDLPWIDLTFCLHSGASADPEGLEGLAHFTEHLVSVNLRKGGKNRNIRKEFEAIGGVVNLGQTDYLATTFSFKVRLRAGNLPKALSIFGEMLFGEEIKSGIEEERQIILNELREHFGNELTMEMRRFWMQNLFKSHWLSRFLKPLGHLRVIEEIAQENLQDFYNQHYVPANISLVGIGGVPQNELMTLLAQSPFGEMKSGSRNPLLSPMEIPAPETNMRIVRLSEFSSVKIAKGHYECGIVLPGKFKPELVLIVSDILYDSFFREFRGKKSWIYDPTMQVERFQDIHSLTILSGFSLAALKDDQLLKMADKCFEGIVRKSFLERSRRRLVNNCYLQDSSSRKLIENTVQDMSVLHRVQSLREYLDELQKITLDDVAQIAEFLKPEKRLTMLFVP